MTQVHTRITARRSWFAFGLRELWTFRGLVRILAVRDVKLRYRQTAMGVAGVVIAPLVTAGVLSLVFGEVADLPSDGVPYLVFSYAGLIGWNVFSGVLQRAQGALLGNASLVSKIYVPRLLLPMSGIVAVAVDFAIS
jgi:lipopolysaccharide transport system permease protein